MNLVKCCAKINLFLKVMPADETGYHNLFTIFQPVELYDEISIKKLYVEREHEVVYSGKLEGKNIFADEDLCIKALEIFIEYYKRKTRGKTIKDFFRINVTKKIPVKGGMAGGSVDAGGILNLLNFYYRWPFSSSELEYLASKIGKDVPFGVRNILSVGTRYGDIIRPLDEDGIPLTSYHVKENMKYCWLLLINKEGLSTPSVFKEFDRLQSLGNAIDYENDLESEVCAKVLDNYVDCDVIASVIRNDLEPAIFSLRPQLKEILSLGEEKGAVKGFISGSGPTCVFLCRDHDEAEKLKSSLEDCSIIKENIDEMFIVDSSI